MKKGDVPPQYQQAPDLPFVFPPAGYVTEYQVQSGERWIDIAERHGVGGWDLIEFNFGTRDEKVYNFCMKYYLGCTHTTDDGLRYNFHQCTIGKIYIPPVGWAPPGRSSGLSAEEEELRKSVLKVLGSPSIKSIRFQNPFLHMTTPDMLMRIASLIARNRVRITVDTEAIANEYDPDGNVIILADADTSNVVTRSTIVHEAVHAGQDAEARPKRADYSECDAYIAQMIYIAKQGYSLPSPPMPVLSGADIYDKAKKKQYEAMKRIAKAEKGIYDVAWEIAQKVIVTNNLPPGGSLAAGPGRYARSEFWDNIAVIPEDDYKRLASAIQTHPLYLGSELRFAKLNGI
jgi:hypothetical protein